MFGIVKIYVTRQSPFDSSSADRHYINGKCLKVSNTRRATDTSSSTRRNATTEFAHVLLWLHCIADVKL